MLHPVGNSVSHPNNFRGNNYTFYELLRLSPVMRRYLDRETKRRHAFVWLEVVLFHCNRSRYMVSGDPRSNGGSVPAFDLIRVHACLVFNGLLSVTPQIATARHDFGIDHFEPCSLVVIPIKLFE